MSPLTTSPPAWQLPQGVSRGVWDYVNSDQIAEDYDNYFSYSQLFDYDQTVLDRHLEYDSHPWVIDLGCGTGRAAVAMATKGARVLGVDLSAKMLDLTLAKAEAADLPICGIQANLVELGGVATESMDYAVSLFSTLGMICGRVNRVQALRHVRRLLKPTGKFILHVHNLVCNLYDPNGVTWMLKSLSRAWMSRNFELGDKYFPYRGLPNMFLHTFSAGELRRVLRDTGFRIVEWNPVNACASGPLRWPWWFGSWRASGWIIVAEPWEKEKRGCAASG